MPSEQVTVGSEDGRVVVFISGMRAASLSPVVALGFAWDIEFVVRAAEMKMGRDSAERRAEEVTP